MQFLLDKLDKRQVDPDGVEIYTDLAGEKTIIVDRNLNRARSAFAAARRS